MSIPQVPAAGLKKHRRVLEPERSRLIKYLVERYREGETIRTLAASTGRSYGFVHRVLSESEVQLRSRGGDHRRNKAPKAPPSPA